LTAEADVDVAAVLVDCCAESGRTFADLAAQSDLTADFATVWQVANKVVYSTTLAAASTVNTQLERHFDPIAVPELKAAASKRSHRGRVRTSRQADAADGPARRPRAPRRAV
jgi:hypothetical protein